MTKLDFTVYRGNFVLIWPFSGQKVSGLRKVWFISVRFIKEKLKKLMRKAFWSNKILDTLRLRELSSL